MQISAKDIVIRPVQLKDTEQILAIYQPEVEHGLASWEYEPPSLTEMADRINSTTEAGYPWLVAEDNGQVLGYAYASSYRPRIGYQYCVEDSVYLIPAARGTGLGKRLLHALINQCTECGFRQMVAVIGDSENQSSIGLHASVGFKPAGILENVGYKNGRWLDSVNMQLSLGEGSQTPPAK